MYNNKLVIDCHVHNSYQTDIDYLNDFLDSTNTDRVCLEAVAHTKVKTLVYQALELKGKYPNKYYVFACPDVDAYKYHQDDLGEYLVGYFKDLFNKGVDGIKLLEGKPQMRKYYDIPDFDLEVWEPFFKYVEDNNIPVLWHVNDPEDFWDLKSAPAFAISQGWLYDDSYVNNEDQYRQVLNVLKRHPNIKICFAHFFFMSKQLNRLADILDTYKNVRVDITPGIEMYENFSENFEESKAFFEKYHDRILYGTDIGGRCVLMGEDKTFDEIENRRRPKIVRDFLSLNDEILIESDGHYIINRKPFMMKCLGLSDERLEEILSKNFLRFVDNKSVFL